MANFDEDIKRITDEILSDGTVDQIIREKVTDGIEKAIASSFNYGKLEKAVKERVEQVLVPFIESYDMSGYIVKLDTLLTEMVNKSVLTDNKNLLENFKFMMEEPQETDIKISDLFKEYKKFVAGDMEVEGREIVIEDNVEEEKPPEHKQERVPMVDPCYYCLCRSCINNAESLTVNPEEVPYDWRPCFFCDICNNFDGESPENMEREECEEYVIDDYHARKNREKLRIVR